MIVVDASLLRDKFATILASIALLQSIYNSFINSNQVLLYFSVFVKFHEYFTVIYLLSFHSQHNPDLFLVNERSHHISSQSQRFHHSSESCTLYFQSLYNSFINRNQVLLYFNIYRKFHEYFTVISLLLFCSDHNPNQLLANERSCDISSQR